MSSSAVSLPPWFRGVEPETLALANNRRRCTLFHEPILQCFRHVLSPDRRNVGEIGDRPGHLQNPVVPARGESKLPGCPEQQRAARRVEPAMSGDRATAEFRIVSRTMTAVARPLMASRANDAPPDIR